MRSVFYKVHSNQLTVFGMPKGCRLAVNYGAKPSAGQFILIRWKRLRLVAWMLPGDHVFTPESPLPRREVKILGVVYPERRKRVRNSRYSN